MCSHYQAIKERERFIRHFGVTPPDDMGKVDLWPGYIGSFIRRLPGTRADDDLTPRREALTGLFGLVPHWSPDTKISRLTYNARHETVASKPSFRDAWKRAQHCIIPAEGIFEPDWRSGRPLPTRISRADGEPMGIAGLWARWLSPQGDEVLSYTMLTINAREHALMRQFHKPDDEKRMVVILPSDGYDAWLEASPEQSSALMRHFPARDLVAHGPEIGGAGQRPA